MFILAELDKTSVQDSWGMVLFACFVAMLVLPFVLGPLIARGLRLKDLSLRISVVLLSAVLGLSPFIYQSLAAKVEQSRYEARLADWEAEQKKPTITDEGVAELKKSLEDVEVIR